MKNPIDVHLLRIAEQTVKMPDAIAAMMGGMTKEEAKKVIERIKGGKK